MSAPTLDYANSHLTQITVDWTALTTTAETRGAAIDTYHLEWSTDSGATWSSLQGQVGAESTALTKTQSTGITGGNDYQFRVTAHNAHGYGTTSSVTTITAATVPAAPAAPTVALSSTTITIDWAAPADNNDAITAYRVKVENNSGTGVETVAECDGSDSDVITNTACEFTMSTLLLAPYSLSVGDSIIVTVAAYNNYGWGADSADSDGTLLAQKEPEAPSAPTRDTGTTSSSLIIDWTAPTTNGASITSYNVVWDSGTSGVTWTSLVGEATDFTALTYTKTGVTSGDSYQFKVRAKNIWGWGAYSSALTIVAAHAPDTMSTVTTAIDATTGGVTITWAEPASNGGAITAYTIKIVDEAGSTWSTETTDCDGSNAAIVSAKSCTIPMSTFAALPFSYSTLGTVIKVKATATNAYGTSPAESTENTSGAEYKAVPGTMSTPTRGAASTESSIVVEWTAPSTQAETGGSSITGYEIVWDAGDGSADTTLAGLVSSYTSTSYTQGSGLTEGDDYLFKVRAKNIYGWGPYSAVATIAASSVPDAMATVTTSVVSGEVKINFAAPGDNGDTITGYDLEIRYSDGTTYAEETTNCDGSDGTIKTNMYCTIPMTLLRAAGTYNLAYGDLVVVRARAYNSIGAGAWSEVNTVGATIETEPGQMTDPFRGSSTSITQV